MPAFSRLQTTQGGHVDPRLVRDVFEGMPHTSGYVDRQVCFPLPETKTSHSAAIEAECRRRSTWDYAAKISGASQRAEVLSK
jgi:hypothetical protein